MSAKVWVAVFGPGPCTAGTPAVSVPDLFQKRSFAFAMQILKLYRALVGTTDVPRHLAYQMLRAGTSLAATLAESKSAYSRRDLAATQTIALRQSRKCHCWLRLIAADQPPAGAATVRPLLDEPLTFGLSPQT